MAKSVKGRLVVDLVVDRYVNVDLFHRNQKALPNGCIEYTGVKSNVGYGFVGFNYLEGESSPSGNTSGMMTAHRLAFMIKHGRLPKQRNVNHTCHNKLCVNPDHLVEGTQREKLDAMVRDGIKGGREVGSTGYAYNHKQEGRKYKYSEADIQWHRTATTDAIAEKYGITKQKANAKRHAFRINYRWLPHPEVK